MTFHAAGYFIHLVTDGTFLLDGGAMFGTVPKPLWSRLRKPDEHNRIRLAMNSLLIRGEGAVMLVDAGMGNKWSEKERRIYGLDEKPVLLDDLARHGVQPEDVTHVLFTHLHLDHAGWATRRAEDGELVPTFPNARHIVQRREWDDATSEHPVLKHSYVLDDLLPLEQSGVVEYIEGDTEVLPGVRTAVTGGHTTAHQMVLVGEEIAFLADLFPTASHLKPHYHMGFDLDPVTIGKQRIAWLERLAEEGRTCFFPHDPETPAGRIGRGEKGYRVEPAT